MNTSANSKKSSTEKRIFNISNGPGRDILFDAFKYAYNNKVEIPASFAIEGNEISSITKLRIQSIEHEDGSGESFNLFGTCHVNFDADVDHSDVELKTGSFGSYASCSFQAYYSVRNRKGTISFYQ